jgi:hypothetical protein
VPGRAFKEVIAVARNGLFNSRTDGERTPGAIDRDHDGVDDRTERLDATGHDHRVADPSVDRDRDGVDDRDEPPARAVTPPVTPVETTDTTGTTVTPVRVPPARASLFATLGLFIGTVGAAATVTGRLAPVGLVLGVVGLLFALFGFFAGARPRVAGRGLGLLGLLLSAAAVVFAILAMTHKFAWLDSSVDEVAKMREFLDVHFPWMSSW